MNSRVARKALGEIAKDAGKERIDPRRWDVQVGQAEIEPEIEIGPAEDIVEDPPRRQPDFEVELGQAEIDPEIEIGQAEIEEPPARPAPPPRRPNPRDLADSNAIGRHSGALGTPDDDLEEEAAGY